MKKIVSLLIWRFTYRIETSIKLLILVLFACMAFIKTCNSQTVLNDSVKVSRMDLMHFAENAMLLKNCEETEAILVNQQKTCNETLNSQRKTIDLQQNLLELNKIKIDQSLVKIETLEEQYQSEKTKRKIWLNTAILLATATTVQSLILILEP